MTDETRRDARDVIIKSLESTLGYCNGNEWDFDADSIIAALHAAGYQIVERGDRTILVSVVGSDGARRDEVWLVQDGVAVGRTENIAAAEQPEKER